MRKKNTHLYSTDSASTAAEYERNSRRIFLLLFFSCRSIAWWFGSWKIMAACARSCFVILQRNLSQIKRVNHVNVCLRRIHRTAQAKSKEDDESTKSDKLIVRPSNFGVDGGARNRDTFLEAIKMYTTRPGPRRGHVEFIQSALKYMDEYGANRDLQAYKSLLDILPKGQYVPTNMFQAEMFYYPKQQDCCLELLQKMEDNGEISSVVFVAAACITILNIFFLL